MNSDDKTAIGGCIGAGLVYGGVLVLNIAIWGALFYGALLLVKAVFFS